MGPKGSSFLYLHNDFFSVKYLFLLCLFLKLTLEK